MCKQQLNWNFQEQVLVAIYYTSSYFVSSKMVTLLCKQITQCTRMEGSHHVHWSSIIYRKRAIHKTEIERLFLAVKSFFNTNLVQFLLQYHVIISKVLVFSFKCTNVHLNGFGCTKSYVRKIIIYEGLEDNQNILKLRCKPLAFTPYKTSKRKKRSRN